MKPYEVPIDGQYRPSIEDLVRHIAAGRLEELVRSGQLASHAVEPTATLMRRFGADLVPLTPSWWEDPEAVMFPVHEPDEWCALLPLRTAGGERGPLWLEVELHLDAVDIRAEVERVFLRPSTTT